MHSAASTGVASVTWTPFEPTFPPGWTACRGAAFGALLTVPILTQLPVSWGWRLAFGLGVILGLVILLVRRHVPESPRWLFIHGRGQEAEDLVAGVERTVAEEDHVELEPADKYIEIRQRKTVGFAKIAGTLIRRPGRAVPGRTRRTPEPRGPGHPADRDVHRLTIAARPDRVPATPLS